jgi:hypothetical protein
VTKVSLRMYEWMTLNEAHERLSEELRQRDVEGGGRC